MPTARDLCRAVTVLLIPFPIRFGFPTKTTVLVWFLVTYLLFPGILNRESTNAVSGNINFGLYIHI